MNKTSKNFALILLIFVLSWLAISMLQTGNANKPQEIPYSTFLKYAEEKKLTTTGEKPLVIQGSKITGTYKNPQNETVAFHTFIAYQDRDLIDFLKENDVTYFMGKPQEENIWWRTILSILPWLVLLGFIWFIMMRQLQSTGNRALSFGRSRAKMNPDMKSKVTFNDVAGVDEAKQELTEVVDFLKEPKKFQAIGAKIPRGVLLVGSPGTGKTLLARAVAGEAGVPFFSISGSDFVEMFVGVGASRVRDLFSQAKKHSPCIVFIDEIDAVGRLRGAGLGGGHDEREQTLNQLLVEMDGFEVNEGIIVVAATNRADVLDPALLRPGRFDRQVIVDAPDLNGRVNILKIHTAKIPLEKEVELEIVARGTPGFTGADLANLVNEAALLAARRDLKKVSQMELDDARDKVLMGPERRSFFISEKEKEVIAYHEAGHAILSDLLENADPIHKVTIIPRGRALGITQHLPEEERHIRSKDYWLDDISVLMGGRLAEEIIFNHTTTGAANDIERATAIARRMVTEWGMSEKLGPIHLSQSEGTSPFIGRDFSRKADFSEDYARMIDEEVKKIIDFSTGRGRALLKKHRAALDGVAKKLLEQETITGEELTTLIKDSKPVGKTTRTRTKSTRTAKAATASKQAKTKTKE